MSNIKLYDDDEIKPWERQPKETATKFYAFQQYLEMGPSRSLKALSQVLGKAWNTVRVYSHQWNWKERIRAYDAFMEHEKMKAKLKAIDEMAKRHIQQSMMYQKVMVKPIEALLNKPASEFESMSAEQLYNMMIKAASHLGNITNVERISRGEPNEIVKNDGSGAPPIINISVSGSKSQLLSQLMEDDPEDSETDDHSPGT